MSNNLYLIGLLKVYLKINNISVKREKIELILFSSYSYPSILSIVQTCKYFGLNIKAYKGDFDSLKKITTPVIVHIQEKNNEKFVLINQIVDDHIFYTDFYNNTKLKKHINDFREIWTGVIITSSIPEIDSEYKNIKNKNLQDKAIYLLSTLCFILFTIYGYKNITFLYFNTIILHLIGYFFTYNIILREQGIFNLNIENFCHLKKSFDCDKVFHFKARKVISFLSFGDIGSIFFLWGLIFLFLSNFINSQYESSLMILLFSIVVSPLGILSIIYQKVVIKKWCPLCLSVFAIIFLEVFLWISNYDYRITFGLGNYYIFIFSFFISWIIFYLSINYIRFLNNSKKYRLNYLKIKRNPLVFASLLNKNKDFNSNLPTSNSIVIGEDSKIIITTLLSPNCGACRKMFIDILEILELNPNLFQWQIRFDGVVSDEINILNKIQLILLQTCNNEISNKKKVQILKDWFNQESPNIFLEKYSNLKISQETIKSFNIQIKENKNINTNKVPSIWINNTELPNEYEVKDIPILLLDSNLILQLIKQNDQ